MRIVYPNVEYLPIDTTKVVHYNHLLKCARITHAADENIEANQNLIELLYNKKHYSVFRHIPHYYILYKKANTPISLMITLHAYKITNNPFINIVENNHILFASTNENFLIDNPELKKQLDIYEVTPEIFYKEAPLGLIYYSFKCTTQISTTRELNRVSPNAICEESTRYCNYTKDKFNGQVALCIPHWFKFIRNIKELNTTPDMDLIDENGEIVTKDDVVILNDYTKDQWIKYISDVLFHCYDYEDLIKSNFKPEDGRGALPLDTASNAIYTYTFNQWIHILNLRLFGTTGRPHPNAKIIAKLIYDELIKDENIKNYLDDYMKQNNLKI